MQIQDQTIQLPEEDRELLYQFFNTYTKWIKSHSLLEHENIKIFADMYEVFLRKNNLTNHDFLMIFLAEMRLTQLVYKLERPSLEIQVLKMAKQSHKNDCIQNPIILKWYIESMPSRSISFMDSFQLDQQIAPKVMQNKVNMQRSREDGFR